MDRHRMLMGEKRAKPKTAKKPRIIKMRRTMTDEEMPLGENQERVDINAVIAALERVRQTEIDHGAFETQLNFYGGGFEDAEILSSRYETEADVAKREAAKVLRAERKAKRLAKEAAKAEKLRAEKQKKLKEKLLKKHKVAYC